LPACNLVVDYPHASGHKVGTVNVVARLECDRAVMKIIMGVTLERDGHEVSSNAASNTGEKSLTVNAKTNDCVEGIYVGKAKAVVTYAPGSPRAEDAFIQSSSPPDVPCPK
jgi:hypothetical protein